MPLQVTVILTAHSSDVGSLTCLACGLATGSVCSGLAKVHQARTDAATGSWLRGWKQAYHGAK